jgi:hypothetical protein
MYGAAKLSILIFYLRLLKHPAHQKVRRGVWVLMALVVAIFIGTMVWPLTFCDPPGKMFNISMPGTCNHIDDIQLVMQPAFQALTDLLILLPPIPIVWRMHFSTTQKVGIIVIFSIGLLYVFSYITLQVQVHEIDFCDRVTGISIVRMGILISNYEQSLVTTTKSFTVDLGTKTYLNYYLA